MPGKSFPPVVLDATLLDLLKLDQRDGEQIETLCKFKPNSEFKYGHAVPLNNKYIIHSAQVGSGEDLAHLQLENTSHLLMFFAGPMNVIFIGSEGNVDDSSLSRDAVDQNAKRSFSVIEESQRPNISTYANVRDLIKKHDGTKIRWGFAMDFAESMPYLIHPDVIYRLNSKRWLAECDLKSANDQIIDNEIVCSKHETPHFLWYNGGDDCQECKDGIKGEVKRVTDLLSNAKAPYVLKLTQSLSAVGTNIVKDDKEKAALVERMEDYLSNYTPRITTENAHLHTTSLILSEFIKGPTHALNFHVRKDGSVIFLGACNQLATGEEGRQSTAMTYADQPELEKKFRKILDDIGRTLHHEGYWGPCGADVMQNPDTGVMFTIDLNVRTALSLLLYLLKGHFVDKHGFSIATIYECTMLTISRDDLEEKFEKELSEARLVLLGATRLGEKKQYAYGMIIAGEAQEAISKVNDALLEYEAKDAQVDG